MDNPSQRLYLNYQGATFHRARTLSAVAVVLFLIVYFVKFPRQTPPPGAVAGPPLADIFLGFAAVLCVLYAIMDALFVVGTRYRGEKSFDEDNLYIIRRGKETIIPLDTITSIRLASSGINNGVRGTSVDYVIEYDYDNRSREVEITIYRPTQDSFNLFKERVQRKNPSVEIKNWSTSLDGLIRLFRRK